MARLGIRRQNPDASPEQIEELLHRLEFARTVTEQDLLLDCVARLIAGSMARDA
jgi:hypothetical protein